MGALAVESFLMEMLNFIGEEAGIYLLGATASSMMMQQQRLMEDARCRRQCVFALPLRHEAVKADVILHCQDSDQCISGFRTGAKKPR